VDADSDNNLSNSSIKVYMTENRSYNYSQRQGHLGHVGLTSIGKEYINTGRFAWLGHVKRRLLDGDLSLLA